VSGGRAARRRVQPSLRARIGRFWLIGLALAAVLGAAAWGLSGLPVFHLQRLVVAGNARVSRAEIVTRASIDPGQNVWFLDRAAIERRIDGIPYVLAAHVRLRAPATVEIAVVERQPLACVRDGAGHELLVDGELRVLEELCFPEPPLAFDVRSTLDGGPGTFLRDSELRALAADARALGAGGDRYRSFAHDAFGELEATLANGIAVRFGDDADLDRKGRLVGPILAQLGPRAGDVRIVDVRAPATPVVEYRK
jgi:cell division protein FtsQ